MQIAVGTSAIRLNAEASSVSELEEIDGLVRIYRPRLLRFVTFSIGDQNLAESIVQDCFLRAYNARESFRGDCTVSTWLFGIANNLIRDHLRTKKFSVLAEGSRDGDRHYRDGLLYAVYGKFPGDLSSSTRTGCSGEGGT
jgi:DNA-directed RNA polymerase specialized sigma24 family protein